MCRLLGSCASRGKRTWRGRDLVHAAFLLSLFAVTRSEPAEKTSDVLELTGATFDEALRRHKRMLVEFYAPWCHYCQEFAPEYEEAATAVKSSRLSAVLAKIDAYKEKDLGSKYGATSYPTLIYFYKGAKSEVFEHEERQATSIVDWLFKKEYPILKEVQESSITEFVDEMKDGEFSLVARVRQNSPRHKAFKKVAEKQLKMYVGFRCAFALLPSTADAKADATLSMWRAGFKDPDLERVEFAGSWTAEKIVLWARNSTYPLIGSSFTSSKYSGDALAQLGLDASVVALMDDKSEEELKFAVITILRPLAYAYPSWKFTTADMNSLSDEDLESLSARKGAEPQLTILRAGKKYVMESPEKMRDVKIVTKFFADVKAGKARPRWKSAPAPGKAVDSDGVTELTGSTFEDYVLDSKRDVLVMFYAPWCGYCKEEAVEWAKVGRDVQRSGWRERGVIVAKMDATANDCLENVTTFPRLWFYPAVKSPLKSKVELAPDTPHEELMDFLLDNARNLGDDDALGDQSGKKKKSMIERELEKKQKGKKASSEL
mmetsp:Transcript_116128/g.205364  ORF Transcript_116128/g.205364 Transcript_116128/m.205364 type:complete len:546 (+) Transcript_116128:43-1680(+)